MFAAYEHVEQHRCILGVHSRPVIADGDLRHIGTTPGIGLGLAICRSIVQAHAGTIVVTNRPEGGACFTFTLPLGNPPSFDAEERLVTASPGGIHGR
ncbi:MAG: hypothetical protein D4R84_01285 [Rhodocyclaceae bacterium]|nr:MAG: hypothetical protein D4R84_01285 [Rhodocyclaceae bacterium]